MEHVTKQHCIVQCELSSAYKGQCQPQHEEPGDACHGYPPQQQETLATHVRKGTVSVSKCACRDCLSQAFAAQGERQRRLSLNAKRELTMEVRISAAKGLAPSEQENAANVDHRPGLGTCCASRKASCLRHCRQGRRAVAEEGCEQ